MSIFNEALYHHSLLFECIFSPIHYFHAPQNFLRVALSSSSHRSFSTWCLKAPYCSGNLLLHSSSLICYYHRISTTMFKMKHKNTFFVGFYERKINKFPLNISLCDLKARQNESRFN